MKKLLLILLLVPLVSFGQYSSYYGTIDVNQNINANVNVNKTVTTIDYGALAAANATRARNRIEASKVKNEKDREAMIAIANDPSKAFDYGVDNNWPAKAKFFKKKNGITKGYKKFTFYHKIPHGSLFSRVNDGYNYQNISDNGIETIFQIGYINRIPYVIENASLYLKNGKSSERLLKVLLQANKTSLSDALKFKQFKIGDISNNSEGEFGFSGYIHKKDLNRATVFGMRGYVATIISEDDFDFQITDYYYAIDGNKIANAIAVFKGDKDEINFEELEGRRFYLKKLIQRTIGSAQYKDVK